MKSKFFKKSVAAAISAAMAAEFCVASLPASVFAYSLNTDYVVYSDGGVTVNTDSATFNGDIYSGDEFSYLGSENCNISKSLNADSTSGSVNAVKTEDLRTHKPDYDTQLKNGVEYRKIYTGDFSVLSDGDYDINDSIYSKGNLRIDRTKFTGRGYIRAKENIIYNAVQNDADSEIFLYSEDGDITVQGSDLTIDGIIYAPEGTVTLNAKRLTFNGTIVAKNVVFNGTDLVVNEIKDKDSSLINFGPSLRIYGAEDTYKENRIITLDISDSTGISDIDTDSLVWSFTAENYENSDSIKVDDQSSGQLVKNLIITDTGIYRVTITGKDKDGNNVKYYDTIEITEDIPPVASFWKDSVTAIRDSEGKAVINLEDTSYSIDGDDIGSRVWSVAFDSDNDGDFSDEQEEIFMVGNETNVSYTAESVGKYRFRLTAAEVFDTIPSLVAQDAYLRDDTSDLASAITDVEVLNEAPESYSGISLAKNIDMVVTVGNAEVSDIDTLNRNITQIKNTLESRGYNVNLSTVSTSTLTAKDTFAWDEYDHYDYRDSYLPTLEKHILFEEDSIKMVGYSWAPLRDWLFVDDGVDAKRILSFDMIRDRTDWHSMEGGGFLFNTTIRDEQQPTADENAEPTYIKKMDGYCILLTSGGFKLIQFNDLDVENFRNGGVSGSMQTAGKVLASVGVADVYDNYNVKIVANSRLVSVYVNDDAVIDNFVLPDNETGTGFGPIICHSSHSCSQQSYFTFSNIKMSTVNGSELSEALDNFDWRDSAEHYVVNLSKESVFDLADDESMGTTIKSLIENDTNFIGLGTADSKSQYDTILKASDGLYMDWYDVLKNENNFKNYILSDANGIDYSVDDMITTSDELVYDNFFIDKDNDPVGQQFWEYDLDSSVYENSSKKSGVYREDEPLSTIEATGLYHISSKVSDDPTHNNPSLDSYKKWSEEVKWTGGLYVHTLPVASVSSKVYATSDPDKFTIELTFDSYDVDGLSHANKGIAEEKFEWKCISDSAWQEGTVPTVIEPEKVYLQKYTVRDEQGAWSKPYVEVIFAEKTANTDMFTDDEAPAVELTVSDENPSVDDQILISVSATDNTEVAYVNVSVNGELLAAYQGSLIYNCDKEGEYEITAVAKDIAGNETTETKTFTVTDRRDLTAPEILIDTDTGVVYSEGTVTISGSIYDNYELDSYKVEYAANGSEDYTQITESSAPVTDGVIASFDIPDAGVYTILVTAADKAGNSAYCKITLTVTEEEVSETVTEEATQPVTTTTVQHVDTPAEITITASTEKAEIGDAVRVSVDTADIDGLVAVKVYKDDSLIAESPVEFSFSEAEAKIVTIKVETLDSYGGKGEKSLDIIIEDNRDKTAPAAEITSPEPAAVVSGKVTITGSAFDETGMREYVLEYKKSTDKSYTSICSSYNERIDAELGVWDTYTLDNGVYDVRLAVTDNGGNVTYYAVQYDVENGAQVNDDDLTEQLIVITKPESGVVADDIIKVEAQTDTSLAGSEYTITVHGSSSADEVINGTVAKDGTISVSVDSSLYPEGTYTVTVAVKGNDVSATKEAKVVVDHNDVSVNGQYICEIVSPEEMDEVPCITDITANISQYVFTDYKFEYSEAMENNYTVFSSGTINAQTEITGEFDPSLLENGYYDIRFTAYGDGIVADDTITVSVTGGLKIGSFSISFEDIESEINGVPLTLTSTYDSRLRTSSGDLGYGWDMSYNKVGISISSAQSENWEPYGSASYFLTTYSLKETKAHRIMVDLGNGKAEEFTMKLSPEGQAFFPLEYGISAYYVSSGTGSTLVPYGSDCSDLIYNGGVLYDSDFNTYDPQTFVYTTLDGSSYVIDAEDGIRSMTTPDGTVVTYTDKGIICSGKQFVSYTRDTDGRITEISTSTGRNVEYGYDVFGDLVSVTDVCGNTKTFGYSKHYLTDIYTSDGVRASRNDYDEDGRLVKTTDPDGNTIEYDHDIDGRQEIVKDKNGGIISYVYDDYGNILSQTDQMGNTVKNTYDADGNITSKTDALGNLTTYKYDSNGNPTEITDAEGIVTKKSYNAKGLVETVNIDGVTVNSYSYDSRGHLTGKTDANGNTTEYTYSEGGKLASVTDSIGTYINSTFENNKTVASETGDGTRATYTYDADGRCASKTIIALENGAESSVTINYVYDEAGRVISSFDDKGNVITTEYNSAGKKIVETDQNGAQTRYSYDNCGNLSQVIYPDNTSEKFTYDKNGNNITAVDRTGRTAQMTYDKSGHLLSKSYTNGNSVTYTYDANYNLISETDENGAAKQYEYDRDGRNTAVVDALGNRTTYTYDARSFVTSKTDAKGNVYKYTYDNNGNLIKTEYPDGTASSATYNERGLTLTKTDRNGYVTTMTYDNMNRLTSVTDAEGGVTKYEYDSVGNLTKQTDANGNVTENSYDSLGRKVKTVNALGQSEEFTYDAKGNIVSSTDFGGKITTFTYDKNDRMTSKKTADTTYTYSYAADGRLLSARDKLGTTTFTYDQNGLSKVTYPNGRYVEYVFDTLGRKTSVATANGTTSYTYDALDRITTVSDKNNRTTSYEYDTNGNCAAVHYADGITVTYAYNSLNNLVSETAVDASGAVVASYEYTLGNEGEILHVKEADRDIFYEYDKLYRLVSEKIVSSDKLSTDTYTYTYDKAGNRVSKTVNGVKSVYTYNALNQLTSGDGITYLYDTAGNLISEQNGAEVSTYEYNGDNMLIKATVGGTAEEYQYDFGGNRVSVKTGDELTYYVNDLTETYTQVIEETNASGALECRYTRGLGLISQERESVVSYYLSDGHESVRQLADANGNITDSYSYDAWGNLIDSTGETVNSRYYCGEQLDGTTGYYYLRARYLNTATGTFTTLDTYEGNVNNPLSLNRYLYAHSNPVMNSDPSGHTVVELAVGFAVSRCVKLLVEQILKGYMEKFFSNVVGDADYTDDYELLDDDSPLDSFEELFNFNNILITLNIEVNCLTMMIGAFKFYWHQAGEEYSDMVSDIHSLLMGATCLADAYASRYTLYDYIFDYAEGKEGYIESMKKYTKANMEAIAISCEGFVSAFASGDFEKGVALSGFINEVNTLVDTAFSGEDPTVSTYYSAIRLGDIINTLFS